MSEAEVTRQRLMRVRARALAILTLTQRPDLMVDDVDDGDGIDLLVHFQSPSGTEPRRFGVALHYALGPPRPEEPGSEHNASGSGSRERAKGKVSWAEREARPVLKKLREKCDHTLPLILAFFDVRRASGWYAWVARPSVSEDGGATLVRGTGGCRRFDVDELNEVVDFVGRWYDAKAALHRTAGGQAKASHS